MLKSILAGVLVIFMFSGCATTTQLTGSWKEPSADMKINKVLVIGKSDKAAVRRIYEDALVNKLKDHQVNAVASSRVLPIDREIDRPSVEGVVSEHGFDSVLVTKLIDVDKESRYVSGMTYVIPYNEYHNFYSYYGHRGTGIVHEPGYTYTETIVSLETNLYETKNAKLIWAITTESVNPDKINKDIDKLAELIAKKLDADDLL